MAYLLAGWLASVDVHMISDFVVSCIFLVDEPNHDRYYVE